MNNKGAQNFKLDAAGQVDTKYYIDLAHNLRAQQMAAAGAQFKSWMATHFNLEWLRLTFARGLHH